MVLKVDIQLWKGRKTKNRPKAMCSTSMMKISWWIVQTQTSASTSMNWSFRVLTQSKGSIRMVPRIQCQVMVSNRNVGRTLVEINSCTNRRLRMKRTNGRAHIDMKCQQVQIRTKFNLKQSSKMGLIHRTSTIRSTILLQKELNPQLRKRWSTSRVRHLLPSGKGSSITFSRDTSNLESTCISQLQHL